MSRKTKADLEAEIQELLEENKDLRYMVNINHDQYKSCCKLLSRLRVALAKQFAGPRGNMTKADKRNEYLLERYNEYRLQGKGVTNARNDANDDMVKKFGKEHKLKLRRLQQLLKT